MVTDDHRFELELLGSGAATMAGVRTHGKDDHGAGFSEPEDRFFMDAIRSEEQEGKRRPSSAIKDWDPRGDNFEELLEAADKLLKVSQS